MTWAPSSHLRDILSNLVAAAFPVVVIDSDPLYTEARAAHETEISAYVNELRRYLEWVEDIPWDETHHIYLPMVQAARVYGQNCYDSYDGAEYDWEHYTNLIEDKLLTLVNKPLKGAR